MIAFSQHFFLPLSLSRLFAIALQYKWIEPVEYASFNVFFFRKKKLVYF